MRHCGTQLLETERLILRRFETLYCLICGRILKRYRYEEA